jgi:hypothetical protein
MLGLLIPAAPVESGGAVLDIVVSVIDVNENLTKG